MFSHVSMPRAHRHGSLLPVFLMISLKYMSHWYSFPFWMRPPSWKRTVQSTMYIPTAEWLRCMRFALFAQCCCGDNGAQRANWHNLFISSLCQEHPTRVHVKVDAANIPRCFCKPVETLSQLISCHSGATPTLEDVSLWQCWNDAQPRLHSWCF